MASRTRRWTAGPLVVALALGLLAALLAAVPDTAVAQDPAGQAIAIVKDDELPSNAELAVRLSEETPLPDVTRVVVSRDDEFADALASGLLQTDAPLLLVPRGGPVPERVLAEIRRVGAGRATILGGTNAVDPVVEQELAANGLTVDRRQGGSRFETAIEIARAEAPDADTVILARAFPADPTNRTQGFADALAAGGMAANNRWPILLSDTAQLTGATRDYLAGARPERVMIVGGTAAISAGVEAELQGMGLTTQRVAGDSRAETAVEIAKAQGIDSAAEVDRIVLVDGSSPNGFAGGFAAAAHAAHFDAPILLADGIRLPPETEAFLQPGAAFAQTPDAVSVTCVVHPLACDGGRESLGLADFPLLDVSPPINSLVSPGQQIQLTLSPADEGGNMPITVKGSCLGGQVELVTDPAGRASFTLASSLGEVCGVDVTYGTATDLLQQGFSYTTDPEFARGSGIAITSDVYSYGAVVPSTPIYVNDVLSCTGPAGEEAREDSAYEAKYLHPDFFVESFALTSFPLEALPGDTCTATAEVPSGVDRVLWGVYSWSDSGLRNPLLLGNGRSATFSFDQIDADVTDVNVVWIMQTDQPDIGVPAPTGPGTPGQVFNPEGLAVTCGGRPVGDGLSFHDPGTPCEVSSPTPGLEILVVEPGRPLTPTAHATFAAPSAQEPVAVYSLVTGGAAQPTTASCADAPELPYASITPGFTTPAAQVSRLVFYGFAGEELRFRADAVETGDGQPLDPILRLYGTDGSLLIENDDDPAGGFNSRIDAALQVEGEYCLEIAGFGGSTGSFLLTADPAPGFTEAGVFSATTPVAEYFYDGVAGDLLILELRAAPFEATDPLLHVYGPDGSLLATDDDGGGYPNSRIVLDIPVTGEYVIQATTYADFHGLFTFEASFLGAGQSYAADRDITRSG